MRKQINDYKNQTAFAKDIHYIKNADHSVIYGQDKNILYYPTSTGKLFHADNSFVRLVFGPYGSGKTTMLINEIVLRACAMPAWDNGQRTSRWAVVRNTSGELTSTTLKSWLEWFGDLGTITKRQKPILNYEHQFNDGNGLVNIELIFLALDRPDDVRKIKSLELTGVYLNELSELPQNALSHFKGRINGRYPSRSFCPWPYWSGIIADTNPCDEDSWIYKDFEENKVEDYKIFYQPPGLLKDEDDNWIRNPLADNADHLSPDYYTRLASGQTEQFIKVFCLGEWGTVGDGKCVFPEYNDDLHSVDHIEAIQGEPLHLSWDFGLTPSCLVGQLSQRGQLRILKEYSAEDMGIKTFAESIVIPNLVKDFPYCKVGSSRADPAGTHRSEIFEEFSCIGELNHVGIETVPAKTNDLEPRIGSVRFFLNKLVDKQPGFVLSRKGCPKLRKGFLKDYVFKRVAVSGEERYKDTPDKNFASHLQDCCQYLCMDFASETVTKEKMQQNRVDWNNPTFRFL